MNVAFCGFIGYDAEAVSLFVAEFTHQFHGVVIRQLGRFDAALANHSPAIFRQLAHYFYYQTYLPAYQSHWQVI
jgi:hypothetical protein